MKAILFGILLAGFVLAPAARAGDEAPVVLLCDEVVVADEQVRWIDLSAGPLESDLGRQPVFGAPAPGRTRTWTRDQILRELVRRGATPVPVLQGSETVRVVRRGGEVPPDVLARRVRAMLATEELPVGAVDQQFEILRLPSLRTDGTGIDLCLDGDVPRVGRGAVPVRLTTSDGKTRRVYAMVSRSLRVPALVARRTVDAHTAVTTHAAVVDTVWTEDLGVFDRLLPVTDLDGRHTLVRRVRGGHLLREQDVRATPVVRRGEIVRWIVERDGLRVEVRARARQDGAVGDWISVLGPYDDRPRRVVVIGPRHVANHIPLADASAHSDTTPRGRP